jgi:hypothetical protein
MSIEAIAKLLREQAEFRSQENDEAGILLDLADQLEERVAQL